VVFDSLGRPVSASVAPPAPEPAKQPDAPLDVAALGRLARGAAARPTIVALPDREGGYRAAIASVAMPDGRYVAAVAMSLYEEAETLDAARHAMFMAIPIALALATIAGWLLARRSLAPMVTMRERAARIGASTLAERLPIPNANDEVGQLAAVINELLGRLEQAFARQREFMADASHELRTPVAVVQHEASLALSRGGRPAAEYEESLEIVRDAGRRMRLIVDDLFLLAGADAGETPVRRAPLYLDEVIGECVREVRSLAHQRGVAIELELLDEAPWTGDEALLHRLVLNLLDNAIKYSPACAVVTVRLTRPATGYRVEVEDRGAGIPPEVQPHVFERFVRADSARSHDAARFSGAGLGLSIARWIAEAHGGELLLVRSSAAGTIFALTLPEGAR
jgi:heavy metal sensor kinase